MKPPKSLLFRQLIWAATLSIGFGTLWLLLVFLLGGFALEAWRGPDVKWPDREELVIKRDGTPLIKSSPRGYPSQETYRGLDGHPQAKHGELIDGTYHGRRLAAELVVFRARLAESPQAVRGSRQYQRGLVFPSRRRTRRFGLLCRLRSNHQQAARVYRSIRIPFQSSTAV